MAIVPKLLFLVFHFLRCRSALVLFALFAIQTISAQNLPPAALDDLLNSPEDASVLINVVINDTDPDGNLNPPPAIVNPPANGTVTVTGDGNIIYTPAPEYSGTDSFTYAICDSLGLCDTAQVIVTVVSAADPVLINISPLATDEDVATTHCVSYSLNNQQDNVTVTEACVAVNGMVSNLSANNGQLCFNYAPNLNFNGTDTVCVQLCDLVGGECTTVQIPVNINAVEDNCFWLKGISPNGNAQNDEFYISCNDDYPSATLRVFNRWGEEVYRSTEHYENNWRGTNTQNTTLPDGTYYYIYDFNDGVHKAHAGFVTINR